jgi:heptosyltransferase-2
MATRLSVLPNWLGDLVMATPALRRFGAGSEHVVVGPPALVDLVLDLGLADRGVHYDRRGADRGVRGLWRCARRLAGFGAESALVLGPSLRAAALPALAGIPERRGVGGEARELFLTDVHRVRGGLRSQHLSRTWWEVAGGSGPVPFPEWRAGPRARRGRDALSEQRPELTAPYAVFAAGATYGPTKRWPTDSFVETARRVRDSFGLLPIFVGSSDARERETAAASAERSGGIGLAGETDLPALVAVLADADLFVGNDSGPMHVAAAVGTPTVGIFGSTSPVWTAPRGPAARSVGPAPVDCSPCFLAACPFALECLRGLAPAAVLDAVDRLLGPAPAREVRR